MEEFLNKLFDKHSEGYSVYDRKQIIQEFTDKYCSKQLIQSCVVGQSEQFYCNTNDGEYNNNPCSEQCVFCKEAESLQ